MSVKEHQRMLFFCLYPHILQPDLQETEKNDKKVSRLLAKVLKLSIIECVSN